MVGGMVGGMLVLLLPFLDSAAAADPLQEGRVGELREVLRQRGLPKGAVMEVMRLAVPGAEEPAWSPDWGALVAGAQATDALAVKGGMRVLQVGDLPSWQDDVLVGLSADVYLLSAGPPSGAESLTCMATGGQRICLLTGPLEAGWAAEAPFDRILVTETLPRVPTELKRQMAVGGRLIVPIGEPEAPIFTLVTHPSAQTWHESVLFQRLPIVQVPVAVPVKGR